MKNMELTTELQKYIEDVIHIVGKETEEFLMVKKVLLNYLPNKLRKLFSKRHPQTKKHKLNSLENELILFWQEKTGVLLKIPEDSLHPDSWVAKPKGWKLSLIKKNKKNKENETKV